LIATPRPDKSQAQIKKIIESAYDYGAEMIVTPCPVCQMNVEVYQGQINKKYGTKFNIPVTYYSQLMAVAYGASAGEAGLDGNIVRAIRLKDVAAT
jgi:heterodisulfide reductase subunit B